MEERDLPAAPHAGATPAERAAFGQAAAPRTMAQAGGSTSKEPEGQATTGQRSGGPSPSNNHGGDTTAQAASGAADRAMDLARDAYDSAATAAGSVRDRVIGSAQQQQNAAADQVDSLAETLRRTADSLPADQGWLSDLTQKGGQQLSDLADTLRRNDLQGLLHKVDGFARNQPALFLGASMAAGFALARVAQVSVAQAANQTPNRVGPASSRGSGSSTLSTPSSEHRTTVSEGSAHSRTDNAATGERRGTTTETSHG